MNYEESALQANETSHRLELLVEGNTAFIDYKTGGGRLFLIHTEVPKELEGKGVAGALVKKAFEYAKANDLKIVPLCAYVQTWLKRHPEWNELIATDADRFMNNL